MASHLARRGGVWWTRLVVPVRLRHVVGRREFVQSCRTADLQVAKTVAAVLLAEWRQTLMRLEPTKMSSQTLRLLQPAPALSIGATIALVDAEQYGVGAMQLLKIAAAGRLKLFCRLSAVSGYLLNPNTLDDDPVAGGKEIPPLRLIAADAIEVVRSGVLLIPDFAQMANALLADQDAAVAEVVALEVAADQWFVPANTLRVPVASLEVSSNAVNAVRAYLAKGLQKEEIDLELRLYAPTSLSPPELEKNLGRRANSLFSEAVDAYCSDPDGLQQRLASIAEVRQRRKFMLHFAEFMGDLPLAAITPDVLRQYRDGPLREFPAKANNLPQSVKRDTMKATIQAIKESGEVFPFLSLEMRQERMAHLSRLFAWLHAKEWINFNPAASLAGETGMSKADRIKEKKQRKNAGADDDEEGRPPFSSQELLQIFGKPDYKTGDGRHISKGNATWYPFEYWLPLLGLYAGCRISEVSQLHLDDVRQVDGHWVLDINEKTPDKRLKTEASSARLIPLHPKLKELGFLEYCSRLRAEGFRRVFPELSYSNPDVRYAKEPIRKMSAILKSLGMPRNAGKVFHCLRHNANDALMRVPMTVLPFADENLRKFIRHKVMGHQQAEDINTRHYTSSTVSEAACLIEGVEYSLEDIAPFNVEAGLAAVRVGLLRKKGHRRNKEDMGPLSD